MKSLCTLLALLVAVPLSAQTTTAPTMLRAYVYTDTGTDVVGPVDVAISATSPLCNLTAPTTTLRLNPSKYSVDDPFHAGKVCTVPMPGPIPDGVNYSLKVAFVVPSCYDSYNQQILQPCEGGRATSTPFDVAQIVSPPPVPTFRGFSSRVFERSTAFLTRSFRASFRSR